MAVLATYSQWVTLLDAFGNGDDAVLEELSNGSFVVDAGTASRFYLHVESAYKKRKQRWLDKFQRSFQFQNFKTDNDVEIALRNGKQNLLPLHRFAMLQAFPANLQETLQKDLEDFIAEIKQSLKDNIGRISNSREKMLLLLNSFGLSTIYEQSSTEKKSNHQHTNNTTPPTGRKIIFQHGK
jgi:hypothetical protein